ncbi:MAG: hypothetical protein EXR51_11090 [Dehalococcoidia bacterium]|nr:hypothetical protein [Dehalococcoidia bacterium]
MSRSIEQMQDHKDATPAKWAPTWEHALWAIIILAALALRLFPNDTYALSSAEGSRALAGWRLLAGAPPQWWDAPALVSTLALVFLALGDSDFAARLPSVVAGVAVVASMTLWRERLGRWPALAAAALLALSPTGISMDRTVHEAGFATAIGFALALTMVNRWNERTRSTPYILGIGTVLLLSLGATGVSVLLSVGLSAVVRYALAQGGTGGRPAWVAWDPLAMIAALAVFILLMKGGFQNLDGAAAASAAAWARQFDAGPEVPWFERWLFLIHAEPLPLALGGAAAATTLTRWIGGHAGPVLEATAPFAIWGSLALVLYGFATGGLLELAYLMSLPLTVLAGITLARCATALGSPAVRRGLLGVVPALAVLVVFGALTSLDLAAGTQPLASNRIMALGLATVLILLCGALLYTSSPRPAVSVTIAVAVFAAFLNLHAVGRAISGELWPRVNRVDGATVMMLISTLPAQPYGSQSVPKTATVAESLQPPLQWYLRNTQAARFANTVSTDADVAVFQDAASVPANAQRWPLLRTLAENVAWTPSSVLVWAMTGRLPDGAEAVTRIALVSKG